MIESEKEDKENFIRKKQDKKIAKHFDIYINGVRFKVVKYLFKTESKGKRTGNYIEFISKFNIIIAERENVKIEILEGETRIEIFGDWAFASWNVGNYNVGYWINDLNKK